MARNWAPLRENQAIITVLLLIRTYARRVSASDLVNAFATHVFRIDITELYIISLYQTSV